MTYQFYTCDVFTDTRFGGNPLAVIPNAEGLSSKQMQQIATEFNYSESTFVFPSQQGHTRHVRIFTPTQEVPFAGHPNIGTAYTLATIGELGSIDDETHIVFEEAAGLVPITIRKVDNTLFAELKAPEDLSIGRKIPIDLLARAISLSPEDIVTSTHEPQVASVGLPFIMIELKDQEALERVSIYQPAFQEIHDLGVMPDIHVYTRAEGAFDIHARMFAPLDGVPEDPATGSANCALVAMLSHYKAEKDGQFKWRISQGVEMKRPSVLAARTQKQDGRVTGVWVAGTCVMVSEGKIELD